MWCVAELDQQYIRKMEDVAAPGSKRREPEWMLGELHRKAQAGAPEKP